MPSVSGDGRLIAFQSLATNLVPGTNGFGHVYVFDRSTSTTSLASVSTSGQQGNGESRTPSISADGRIVCFTSRATNLVPGGTNGWDQVVCRDLATGQTTLVSVNSSGEQGDQSSYCVNSAISSDGRFVAFTSNARNLVMDDTNFSSDVFVHDRVAMTTRRVSVASGGVQAFGHSSFGSISGDGARVAFLSESHSLDPAVTFGFTQGAFIHDSGSNETRFISYNGMPAPSAWFSYVSHPSISQDGNSVAFTASNSAVYVRNLQAATTARIDVGTAGDPSNMASAVWTGISANGRFVTFQCLGNNLVPSDANGTYDVFVRDRWAHRTTRVSVATGGEEANARSDWPAISADGRVVAFLSDATNLVTPDGNNVTDPFAHERAPEMRPGDLNNDGVVDFLDLNIVLSNFGAAGAPGAQPGDVDDDGDCDFTDLNIVLGSFGMPV